MQRSREDTMRQLLAARAADDFDAALDCITEDVVIDASRRLFDPVVLHGHDGFLAFVSMLDEAWKSQHVEPLEFIERGDALVVPVRLVSTGRGSGIEVGATPAWVATFRGDKIATWTVYQSREDALADVPGEDGVRG
ncbi:MAG TPA: nuclear transport factor 2 family protein [Solirubrobacterales bacterium]|nr:nuclear transport factor 2 family protein [Solirubrobacterales bacterium]